MKIWGRIEGAGIVAAREPVISAQCIRVPASDGHMAAVFVQFEKKAGKEEILGLWKEFAGRPQQLSLPSAPKPFLQYFEDESRPQTRLDRDAGNGQAISLGRLRPDANFDWKFVALSHNTVRGAAGGAVLTAELLKHLGFLTS
jgi:aspartate-semialdehyde dehydrogenase